jgi:hypothetical protein
VEAASATALTNRIRPPAPLLGAIFLTLTLLIRDVIIGSGGATEVNWRMAGSPQLATGEEGQLVDELT